VKEGYLQEKIRELDFKLNEQRALAEQLDKHLQRVIVSEKEQKKLFGKLKQLEAYKKDIQMEIIRENRDALKENFEKSKRFISRKVQDAIENSLGRIQNDIALLSDQMEELKKIRAFATDLQKNVMYSEQLCRLLLEEMIQNRVFSKEKMEILLKRASIRAESEMKKK
jgi:hypothetical protein